MTAICKELKGVKVKEINKEAMEISLTHNRNKWRIVTLYSRNIEEILEAIMEEIQEEEEDHFMLGGDFKARTGGEGGPVGSGEEEEERRRSKDKEINKEGGILINKCRERGWMILNGSYGKEGEWTYIGEQGASVIDYVITNDKAIEEVKMVGEGNRTESDHMPIEVKWKGRGWKGKEGRKATR